MSFGSKILGQRFNLLTALSIDNNLKHPQGVVYKFICDCGSMHSAVGRYVVSGKVKSCGCLQKKKNRKSAILELLYSDKKSSKHFNVESSDSISFEDFCKIVKSPCYYCGEDPCSKKLDFNGGRIISSEFVMVNGIDRIDSLRGYERNNVRPCCKICNFGKSNYTEDEFFSHIKKIGIHQRKKGG